MRGRNRKKSGNVHLRFRHHVPLAAPYDRSWLKGTKTILYESPTNVVGTPKKFRYRPITTPDRLAKLDHREGKRTFSSGSFTKRYKSIARRIND